MACKLTVRVDNASRIARYYKLVHLSGSRAHLRTRSLQKRFDLHGDVLGHLPLSLHGRGYAKYANLAYIVTHSLQITIEKHTF